MTLVLSHRAAPVSRDQSARGLTVFLTVFLIATSFSTLLFGASSTSLFGVIGQLLRGEEIALVDKVVLWNIRLPRLTLGILVGAALAVSGAVMQGLFRNPLADPGLVGVSAGASLGAIIAIVLGGLLPGWILTVTGGYLVPIFAFCGGWGTTILLYMVATRQGRTSIATMLLAGIALAALTGAVSGLMVYLANDAQLRDLTFWGMGSLAGATWVKVLTAAPFILLALLSAPFLAKGLNALALGEASASHMGVPVERLKSLAILAVAGATGAAVAVSGGIGFIGIVVPHLLRLAAGPDHRHVLINSGLLGASVLLWADAISRVIVAPAELPIGIITAVLGGPIFLWVLLKQRSTVDL